ncbi:MAG TPA: DUF4178 domain-containing protein [Myxococcales bacterium]|jgi:hypothetical protein|nr:DUF4178 domain-containing protein [Myxococcales bacterium]
MTSACPNCGAPIEFAGAQSLAAVCKSCRSAVVRSGADLVNVGKVPDLVATGSKLALGARGAVEGKTFTIIGHLQLSRVSGDAAWDEWYVSFASGSWGWLAEAQGHLLLTHPRTDVERLPGRDSLRAGQRIWLGKEQLNVDEVNDAKFVTAEGELPYEPSPFQTYRYADCSDAKGGFATIDFGSPGDSTQLFSGRELAYADAGLADFQSIQGRHPEGHALTCPNCGANIGLKIVSSESVACPSCRALLDATQQPAKLLAQLKGRTQPALPLGAKGRIGPRELEVIGWMNRNVLIDGTNYWWEEYLLHGAAGYRWLTVYAGHWLFVEPIAGGKVTGLLEGAHALCDGRSYRHFQTAMARYDEIQGELYWRIETGQRVQCADYVAPPYMLSSEKDGGEISWSRGEYMTGAQVWAAFQQTGAPPKAHGVGAAQPNPIPAVAGRSWGIALAAASVVMLLALGFSARKQTVLELPVPMPDAGELVTLSPPFELSGGPQAVRISARAAVQQAWIGLDVALINDESGESDAVGFELSHYEGFEGGEHWSEGSESGQAIIGSVPDGRYVLRVEPESQKEASGKLPPSVWVAVERRPFVPGPLVLALTLIFLWPIVLWIRGRRFEQRRWAESDHPVGGG